MSAIPSQTVEPSELTSPCASLPLFRRTVSGVRNKIVRGQLLAKQKKEKAQAKLRKRIARKEAENRGEVVERGAPLSITLRPPQLAELTLAFGPGVQDGLARSKTQRSGSETLRSTLTLARVPPK